MDNDFIYDGPTEIISDWNDFLYYGVEAPNFNYIPSINEETKTNYEDYENLINNQYDRHL